MIRRGLPLLLAAALVLSGCKANQKPMPQGKEAQDMETAGQSSDTSGSSNSRLRKAMSRICGITIPAKNTHRKNTDRMLTIQIKLILYLTLIGRLCRSVLY